MATTADILLWCSTIRRSAQQDSPSDAQTKEALLAAINVMESIAVNLNEIAFYAAEEQHRRVNGV